MTLNDSYSGFVSNHAAEEEPRRVLSWQPAAGGRLLGDLTKPARGTQGIRFAMTAIFRKTEPVFRQIDTLDVCNPAVAGMIETRRRFISDQLPSAPKSSRFQTDIAE